MTIRMWDFNVRAERKNIFKTVIVNEGLQYGSNDT